MFRFVYNVLLTFLIISILMSIFLFCQIWERNKYLDELIDSAVNEHVTADIDQIALLISREIYRKTNRISEQTELDLFSFIETFSFLNMTSAVSLEYGTYGVHGHSQLGACGTMSRTLLNALWTLDIRARKLQLLDNEKGEGGGHTMIEFFYDGRWRVLSPSDNSFVWKNPDGSIATARDIQRNGEIFSQIFTENPRYPYLFYNYRNIRWEKLPPSFRALMKSILGEEKYNSAETPKFYDLPRNLFLITSVITTFIFASSSYFVRRKISANRNSRSTIN